MIQINFMTDESITPLPLLSAEKENEMKTLMREFGSDPTFVHLKMRLMDLLEEHNYAWMKTYFPFGNKRIPTFGTYSFVAEGEVCPHP